MVQSRAGSGNTVGVMVRMPEDLRDRIRAAADSDGRSMNSEIVSALREAYPPSVDQDTLGLLIAEVMEGPEAERANAVTALNQFLRSQGMNMSAHFLGGKLMMTAPIDEPISSFVRNPDTFKD